MFLLIDELVLLWCCFVAIRVCYWLRLGFDLFVLIIVLLVFRYLIFTYLGGLGYCGD